jgi:surfeit locus 1 family protein
MTLDDGRVVLIDRGWLPPERRAPETRPESQIGTRVSGPVSLVATLRTGGWSGYQFLRPENDPAGNAWVWMELPRMAESTGLDGVASGFYLAARAAPDAGGLPIGRDPEVAPANNHLIYAITWYALAFALLVIYLLHQSRPEQDGKESR